MPVSLSVKIIKYGFNLLGLVWILYITDFSYCLLTGNPGCDQVVEVVLSHSIRLFRIYFLFLAISTGINFLIEWKLEKKMIPKEYLFILAVNFVLVLVISFLVGKVYYATHCR